jgi:hypothetical protein
LVCKEEAEIAVVQVEDDDDVDDFEDDFEDDCDEYL